MIEEQGCIENVKIIDEMNCWFSSSNQRLGTHLLRVVIKQGYFHQLLLMCTSFLEFHYNQL